MKPCLHIESVEDGKISFVRGENVEDELWSSLTFWWLEQTDSEDDRICIPIHDFLVKRSWIRSKWIKDGGTVEIDIITRKTLNDAISSLERFNKLFSQRLFKTSFYDDTHLKRTLTNFQKRDVSRLLELPAGANFSVPGAGKTTSTLVVWDTLRRGGSLDRLLVICPRSSFEAWTTEPSNVFYHTVKVVAFDDEPLDPDIDILVLNYEKLENENRFKRIVRWLSKCSVFVVLDEAHRVKGGAKSIRWRRCRDLSVYAKRIDLLTGTPMPQSFEDLRNLFGLTWPNVPKNILSDSALRNMSNGSIFVRTTKNELGLPPLKIYSHQVDMGDKQAEIYSALCRAYSGTFRLSGDEESYFGSKGRAVMTLIAAASNPGLLAGIYSEDAYLGLEWPPRDTLVADSLLEIVQSYASLEMPPKYKWIREFCQKAQNEGRKVLVWSNLIGNILALSRVLEPLKPVVIYGAVSTEDRITRIDQFRNDPSCYILISNPQTLGEGISLHNVCHDAIYLDRSYNAGQYLQSIDRIHRLGLPKYQRTCIHLLQSRASIDQRIAPRLEYKIEMLSKALNDEGLVKNSLPDETAELPDEILGIDQFDLNDLFSHLSTYE